MREREPGVDEETPRSRAARLRGLLEVALAVVRAQTVTARGRTIATVCIVALTVANLLLVTGVALALADDESVAHDAELRVVPDDSGVHGTATGVEDPRLGESNERAATIAEHDGVTHATPVLAEPIRIEHPETGHEQYLLLVGVVPGPEPTTIAGLSTDTMESGDSRYADGTDDGDPAGEIVLSTEAAETLEADAGDSLEPGNEVDAPGRSYTVVDVDEPADGDTEIPVALVHLSELQSMTGADTAGLADQVLVWGEADAAQTAAADAYPEAELETGGPTDIRTLFGDELALATSILALIVAFAVCSLLVATTAGLRVESDRRTLATLGAVGFPTGSRLLVVATTTLATAGAGALLGLVLGVGGIAATNAIATATVAPEAVAVVHPLFVPYAIGVAVLSTLVALPYPLALAARTDLLAEVDR